jgi:putative membrane protein
MLWLKALHLIFMVTWFAGLFYLPRLYVYHAQSDDPISNERFKTMERKLFYGIMTPSMLITFIFGFWMLADYAWSMYSNMGWIHVKLALLMGLVTYHYYCYRFLNDFKLNTNQRSHTFYRWFNEVPVLFLVLIIILAVVKPF